MHEARQYTKKEKNSVKCSLCSHRCAIADGKHGICGVRQNEGGTLYATSYGLVSAEAVDPIEKKPLFHFLPGTLSYSLGGIGCNFRCEHCQNWQISQVDSTSARLIPISPKEGVARALDKREREHLLDIQRTDHLARVYAGHGHTRPGKGSWDLLRDKRLHHGGGPAGTLSDAFGVPGGPQGIFRRFLPEDLRGAPPAGAGCGSTRPGTGYAYRDRDACHPRD